MIHLGLLLQTELGVSTLNLKYRSQHCSKMKHVATEELFN